MVSRRPTARANVQLRHSESAFQVGNFGSEMINPPLGRFPKAMKKLTKKAGE
jgi:hypothetical protein